MEGYSEREIWILTEGLNGGVVTYPSLVGFSSNTLQVHTTLPTLYLQSTFCLPSLHTHTLFPELHTTHGTLFFARHTFFVLVILKCSMDLIERVALEMVTSVQIKQINFHNQFLEKNNERD